MTDNGLPPQDLTVAFDRISRLDGLDRVWLDLEGRSRRSYFQSWGWIGNWLQELPPGIEPKILNVQRGSTVVGLAALVAKQTSRHRFLRSKGLYLSETGAARYDQLTMEYNGFLVERKSGDTILRHCLEWLSDREGQWDELYLSGLAAVNRERYERIAGAIGLRTFVRDSKACFYVDLDTVRQRGGDYIEQRSGNTRYQVRRSLRRYQAYGQVTLEVAKNIDQALIYFAELKKLHQTYWIRRGQPGAFANEFFERFHTSLIKNRFAEREIQLLHITAGLKTIGYLYNFYDRGRVYAYQSGFNYDADPKLKPGLVSHCVAIGYYLTQKVKIYDFMAGDSQHKRSLATNTADMTWLVLQRDLPKYRMESVARSLKRRIRGEAET